MVSLLLLGFVVMALPSPFSQIRFIFSTNLGDVCSFSTEWDIAITMISPLSLFGRSLASYASPSPPPRYVGSFFSLKIICKVH
jgi:hypothetical protein